MSERLVHVLAPEQLARLREMGKVGDQWRQLLREAGGDEELAQVLAEARGVEQFGGTPPNEKPKLEGPSPRVAAQRHAAKRQG